jgi:hypothetical protein
VWIVVGLLTGSLMLAPTSAFGAAACPSGPLVVSDLVRLQQEGGPLSAYPLSVAPLNERAYACFGKRELRFIAFVNRAEGLGGASAYAMTPRWLTDPSLTVFGTAHELQRGFGSGPFFFISVRPGRGDLQARFARQWVAIRGHFGDRAATTCRAVGPAGATPSPAQAVAICRTMFVLSSIERSAPPETGTGTTPPSSVPDGSPVALLSLAAGAVWLLAVLLAPGRAGRGRNRGVPVGGGLGGGFGAGSRDARPR